jgi:pimeloyl-ACP methyl ester carboxylesterase
MTIEAYSAGASSQTKWPASMIASRLRESMRYVRRYPEELPVLAELLPRIAVPVTIINGRHDPVVPLANAEFLHARLPNLGQETRPDRCADPGTHGRYGGTTGPTFVPRDTQSERSSP